MKKSKTISLASMTIFCIGVLIVAELLTTGILKTLPEKYSQYGGSLWNFIIVLMVLVWALVRKIKVTNFKIKAFLEGVFKYGIWMTLFIVVYISISVWWMNKWGGVYNHTKAEFFYLLKITLIDCLMVGIAEEFLLRGVVQNNLFKTFSVNIRKDRLVVCLYTSLLFGLIHVIGYSDIGVFWTVFKIISGFMLGIFFSAIVIKTNNIFSVMLLHALYDYVLDINVGTLGTPETFFLNQNILIIQVVLIIAVFIQGMIMIWKGNAKVREKE